MLFLFTVSVFALCVWKNGLFAEEHPDPVPENPVFFGCGDRGETVLALEKRLLALGYDAGAADGIYTVQTARAVRQFQKDIGLFADGVCTEATRSALFYAEEHTQSVTEEALRAALTRKGCPAAGPDAGDLRDALILFQRTSGLCGSGTPGYATLRALGFSSSAVFGGEDTRSKAEERAAAEEDFRILLLADQLSDLLVCYPQADDLRTLTAAAALLCRRAEADGFPDTLAGVCRFGWNNPGCPPFFEPVRGQPHPSPRQRARILAAAEAALHGTDPGGHALYLFPVLRGYPPKGYFVTARTPAFYFCRLS